MNEPMDELSPEEKALVGEKGASLGALRAHHADCPRLEILMASQSGVLPEETAQAVTAHVSHCEFCQLLLKDMTSEGLVTATAEEERRVRERVFGTAKPKVKAANARGRFFPVWFWKAAPLTAIAAVLAVAVWVRLQRPATPVSPTVTTVEQAANPATPSGLQWEKLPIKLQAQSVLVWRGEPRTAQEKYASQLTVALAFYRDENYEQAVPRLADVAKRFPTGVEAQLYLGVSQIKLEQNYDAILHLEAAQRLGPEQFRDDAAWYLALAYYRSGKIQESLAELQKLCGGNSGYASKACGTVKELSGR